VGCAQRRPTPRDHFLIYCASHLIYSTISPLPLTKYSNFITESYHIRLVPQKSLHKIRILNSAKAFTILSCRRFVLHISPTRAWRINKSPSAEPHAGGRHTYVHMTGCCPVPQRDHLRHCLTTSVPCSLQHDVSHLCIGGPEPCVSS
jgi:hypothetical protein